MDPNDEKALLEPAEDGSPKFRPAQGIQQTVGAFVIVAGFLCLVPGCLSLSGASGDVELVFLLIAMGFFVWAGLLISLGVQSIEGQNRSRKLLLSFGWGSVWFAGLAVLALLICSPGFVALFPVGSGWQDPAMYLGFIAAVMIAGVAGPGALLILVFSRKNVELTTKFYDDSEHWTDHYNNRQLVLWWIFVVCAIWVCGIALGLVYPLYKAEILPSWIVGYSFILVNYMMLIYLYKAFIQRARWLYVLSWVYIGLWMVAMIALKSTIDINPELQASMNDSREARHLYRVSFISAFLSLMSTAGYLFYIRKDFLSSSDPPSDTLASTGDDSP